MFRRVPSPISIPEMFLNILLQTTKAQAIIFSIFAIFFIHRLYFSSLSHLPGPFVTALTSKYITLQPSYPYYSWMAQPLWANRPNIPYWGFYNIPTGSEGDILRSNIWKTYLSLWKFSAFWRIELLQQWVKIGVRMAPEGNFGQIYNVFCPKKRGEVREDTPCRAGISRFHSRDSINIHQLQ